MGMALWQYEVLIATFSVFCSYHARSIGLTVYFGSGPGTTKDSSIVNNFFSTTLKTCAMDFCDFMHILDAILVFERNWKHQTFQTIKITNTLPNHQATLWSISLQWWAAGWNEEFRQWLVSKEDIIVRSRSSVCMICQGWHQTEPVWRNMVSDRTTKSKSGSLLISRCQRILTHVTHEMAMVEKKLDKVWHEKSNFKVLLFEFFLYIGIKNNVFHKILAFSRRQPQLTLLKQSRSLEILK